VEERYPYFERCCAVINENVQVLNISGDSKTLLTSCDTVLTNLKPLLEMELKGITGWLDTPVHEAYAEVEATREELVEEMAKEHMDEIKRDADIAEAGTDKVEVIHGGITDFEDMEGDFGPHAVITQNIRVLKALAYNVQFKGFLEAARKAEIKKEYKEALEQYEEALSFLMDNNVKDSAQAKTVAQLEQKIAFLEQRD
jgi:hypothetical protein